MVYCWNIKNIYFSFNLCDRFLLEKQNKKVKRTFSPFDLCNDKKYCTFTEKPCSAFGLLFNFVCFRFRTIIFFSVHPYPRLNTVMHQQYKIGYC